MFQKYLIIPINWTVHLIGSDLDFGEKRKELNLNRLIEIGNNHGKSVILLFSISPNPLHSNGGIPSSLAYNYSMTKSGLNSFTLFGQDLIKFYSFFDTQVYRGFSEFVKKVAKGIKAPEGSYRVATAEFGSLDSGEFNSFFEDYGNCFKKSFTQYLSSLDERDKKSKKIGLLKIKFQSFVKSLYFKEVHRQFSSVFLCHQFIGVINTGEKNSLENIFSKVSNASIGSQIIEAFSNEIIPLSFNIEKNGRNEIFSTQVKQLINANYLDRCFDGFSETEDSIDFLPLSLFNFVCGNNNTEEILFDWKKIGLLGFLNQYYGKCFNTKIINPDRLRDTFLTNKILFVAAKSLNQRDLFILKEIFVLGAKIILDVSNISSEAELYLKEFLAEREIKKEVVNIGVVFSVHSTSKSSLLIFDSADFDIIHDRKSEIWKKVIRSLDINHFNLNDEENGVLSCWRRRMTKPTEMDFAEIRRLSLYNISDYKREITLKMNDGFYLLKSVDKQNVSLEKEDHVIKMNFSPKSSISLDFGIIYE